MSRIALALLVAASALPTVHAGEPELAPRSFNERCADPDVVLCDSLDDAPARGFGFRTKTKFKTLPEALKGTYGDWRWCTHDPKVIWEPPVIDRSIKASGSGSLKFTVPGQSKDDTAGYCQINFTPNNGVQFGEHESFYVQFRVRFSCEMLYLDCDPASPDYKTARRVFRGTDGKGSSFKISIINTGDHPLMESPASSCSNQHLVVIGDGRGVIQGYHSCDWYDGHKHYVGLDQKTGRGIIDLQPKPRKTRPPAGICHHADSPLASRDNPTANCILLTSDEWLTITQKITIGEWSSNANAPARSSNVKLWLAREGQAPQLVYDYDRNLNRPERPFMKYGKIWLIPFFTNKDVTEVNPTAHVWYDELIVSRGPIAPAK